MAWSDPADTPSAVEAEALDFLQSSTTVGSDHQKVERQQSHRGAGTSRMGGAATGAGAGDALGADAGIVVPASASDSPETQAARISRLGAEATLKVHGTHGFIT